MRLRSPPRFLFCLLLVKRLLCCSSSLFGLLRCCSFLGCSSRLLGLLRCCPFCCQLLRCCLLLCCSLGSPPKLFGLLCCCPFLVSPLPSLLGSQSPRESFFCCSSAKLFFFFPRFLRGGLLDCRRRISGRRGLRREVVRQDARTKSAGNVAEARRSKL